MKKCALLLILGSIISGAYAECKLKSWHPAHYVIPLSLQPTSIVPVHSRPKLCWVISAVAHQEAAHLLKSPLTISICGLVSLLPQHGGSSISKPLRRGALMPNYLPAHRTLLITALDQFNDTKLMKNVPARELAPCHHLLHANSAVL